MNFTERHQEYIQDMILGGMIKLIAQPPLSLVTRSHYIRLCFKKQDGVELAISLEFLKGLFFVILCL